MAFSANRITKEYGHRRVLADVSVGLTPGDKIALIGANGAGKSTLVRILAGLEKPDEGTVTHSARDEIGYLAQHVPTIGGETISDAITSSVAGLKAIEERMRELEQQMVEDPSPDVLEEYGELSQRFEARGGYEIAARTGEVLASLGVAYLSRNRLIAALSGGEKARVALAALLLAVPDLLLLDEPTNDLDDRALAWLEGYLKTYKGAILFVTHDRDFIDAVATAILELDEHTHGLTRYEGNYGRYLEIKRASRIRAEQAYEAYEDELAALRDKLRTTARQVSHGRAATDPDKSNYNFRGKNVERAISRNVRNALERLERLEASPVPSPTRPLRFQARFAEGTLNPGTVAIDARDLSVRYGSRTVLDRVSCFLAAGSRVCLIGQNGTGKSTLLRILAGRDEPQAGKVLWAADLRIGYLPQHPSLPEPAKTVADNITLGLRQAGLAEVTDEARGWLVRWGLLTRDDLTKKVRDLSIGQQRKAELGILVGSSPDLLLLDEPTNHLSFDVIESLQEALTDFHGPMLIVTHDRRLIRQLPTSIWTLLDGHLIVSEATPRD